MNKLLLGLVLLTAIEATSPNAEHGNKKLNIKEVVHKYSNTNSMEFINFIAVDMSKVRHLVPDEYILAPASSLGVGRDDQAIFGIASFQGFHPSVDGRRTKVEKQIAIDIGVVIQEPSEASELGLSFPGAFQGYVFQIFTNDKVYADSLHRSDIPVQFNSHITYQREMDDETGVGNLEVVLSALAASLKFSDVGTGYAPANGLQAVFWHNGPNRKSVLHFQDDLIKEGNAYSQVYVRSDGPWANIVEGGGQGSCSSDPVSGFICVQAPSLNLRYPTGTKGELLIIKKP